MIDNNSDDKSLEIAKKWIKKDLRFILISEKKQGVMFASNAGSQKAKGKYVARMDADDWSYPERLEKQADFLDKNANYGAVASLVEYVSEMDDTEGFARYVEWINTVQTYEEILKKQFIESLIVNPSAMWRKEVAEKHKMYKSGDFPEDYELWLRWINNGVKIKKIPEMLLKWFDSENRLTRTDPIYSVKSFYQIKSKYLAEWLKKNNPFHPYISVWGASRISRRRAKLLDKHGIINTSYIDIRRNRILDKEVIYYQDIPSPKETFVLVYIKQMDARDEIQDFLHSKGYEEGKSYLLVS